MDKKKVIIIIIAMIALFCSCFYVLWFGVMGGGQTTTLESIFYSSESVHNESVTEIINSTILLNSSQFVVTANESSLTKKQRYYQDYFSIMSGISKYYSFQCLVENNQSIYYKKTELKNEFVFLLYTTDDGTIRFVSGIKTLWRTGWHKDDPNFNEHKKLAHQRALQQTQEILDVLNLRIKEKISFQEEYF